MCVHVCVSKSTGVCVPRGMLNASDVETAQRPQFPSHRPHLSCCSLSVCFPQGKAVKAVAVPGQPLLCAGPPSLTGQTHRRPCQGQVVGSPGLQIPAGNRGTSELGSSGSARRQQAPVWVPHGVASNFCTLFPEHLLCARDRVGP